MDPSAEAEKAVAFAPPRAAWLGGGACIVALALWAAQLLVPWLGVGALGAALWTARGVRRGDRWALAVAVLLWAAVGLAAGTQYRLWSVASRWPVLEARLEDRAAAALNAALDDLVERGEGAVERVAGATSGTARVTPSAGLFARLADIRREADVSALAVFDSAGRPLVWAGEHRGTVPLSVRRGANRYTFHEGPLFSYLYFARPLERGRTAVAAALLESNPGVDRSIRPFAERFASRQGPLPLFAAPERARGESVWDWSTDRPILSVSFTALTQHGWWSRVVERGRRAVGGLWLAALALLVLGWYRRRMPSPGVPVALVTVALLLAPTGALFGGEQLFSPLQFVLPLPWDVSLGMLLVLLLGLSVWLLTRVREGGAPRPVVPWWAQVAGAAALLPVGVEVIRRSASSGLLAREPAGGVALQIAATLIFAVPLFLLLRYGRPPGVGRLPRRPLLALGALAAVVLAVGLIATWRPDRAFPSWVPVLWAVPFALVAAALPTLSTRHAPLRAWAAAGTLAAVVALSHLWVLHVEAKLQSAERELARLGTEADPYLDFLLRQFAERAARFAEVGEEGVNLLYHSWVASGLARSGYEARLSIWDQGRTDAELKLTEFADLPPLVPVEVAAASDLAEPVVQRYTQEPGVHYLLLAPLPDGRTVSVAVPPRSRLGRATALARFLQPQGGTEQGSPVEAVYLVPADLSAEDTLVASSEGGRRPVEWMQTEAGWRSEARAHFPTGWMHAHLFVRTSSPGFLLVRGVLALSVLLGVLLTLWALARMICRDLALLPRLRKEWVRSFRGRLTLALFAFFLLPTLALGVVAYSAVAREVVQSAAAVGLRALSQTVENLSRVSLAHLGKEVDTDLLLYRDGALTNAAAPEVLDLGLFHSWLPPEVYLAFASGEDLEEVEARRLGQNEYLVAYRRLDPAVVVAAPVPLASEEIARRQKEFRDLALLLSLLGAGLSVVLALLVGRALTRPIDELSRAAALVGSGDLRVRIPEQRPDEFGSVYRSFNRMVRRLRRARTALVRETRRTEAIVGEAATGVLALDSRGRLELVNPRAAEILGAPVQVGEPLPRAGALLTAVADAFQAFWSSGATESATELEIDGRIVRLRLRRLRPIGGPRGTVVALEDVTTEIRSARVLAWGEMARQVAHEIKNPLTPIKLAVQHLRRAFHDGRPDYGDILERNVDSVLHEIDRLGEIARAFARFGAPQTAVSGPERVDVVRAVEETLALYRGTGEGITYRVDYDAVDGTRALARVGELKEVLVNLLENAREALNGSGEIDISVRPVRDGRWIEVLLSDTGEGIPPELLPQIFEPHFSTRTSGTGLGLAIVRRLVESWGGEVSAESKPGRGTRMRILLQVADSVEE